MNWKPIFVSNLLLMEILLTITLGHTLGLFLGLICQDLLLAHFSSFIILSHREPCWKVNKFCHKNCICYEFPIPVFISLFSRIPLYPCDSWNLWFDAQWPLTVAYVCSSPCLVGCLSRYMTILFKHVTFSQKPNGWLEQSGHLPFWTSWYISVVQQEFFLGFLVCIMITVVDQELNKNW